MKNTLSLCFYTNKTLFILLLHLLGGSSDVLAGDPFVYTPQFITEFKQMKIDKQGITVVTGNRQLGSVYKIVLYHLDHSRSLNWVIEDSIEAKIIDATITDSAIYVLYSVIGKKHKTEVARFSRKNGSLVWRKNVDDVPSIGKKLMVNENTNTLAIAGEYDSAIQVWWFDTNGNLQFNWSKDLAFFSGPLGSDYESINDLHLLDDNSVITSSTMYHDSMVRVIRTNMEGEILFDYSHKTQNGAPGEPSLLVLSNNTFAITFFDENLFGVPRFNQLALDSDGIELFLNHSDNKQHWGFSTLLNITHPNGNILNVRQADGHPYDLEIYQTDINGQDSHQFGYIFSGSGHIGKMYQIVLDSQNSLFLVASKTNPFPDFASDTLYLQWSADGVLCNEFEVDGSDSRSVLQFYDKNIYELRYIKDESDVISLHVIKHPIIEACTSDIIFTSGFESL